MSLKNCFANAAFFEGANLTRANLEGASIDFANFQKANLRGAIMKCKGIINATFDNAIFDSTTVWPQDFDPINKGLIKVS